MKDRIFPSIKVLADELAYVKRHACWDDVREYGMEPGDETPYVDVRLQVVPSGEMYHASGWSIHTGDSSYDTSHVGYWGSSSLSPGCNCREIAIDLLDQARDMQAEQEAWNKATRRINSP